MKPLIIILLLGLSFNIYADSSEKTEWCTYPPIDNKSNRVPVKIVSSFKDRGEDGLNFLKAVNGEFQLERKKFEGRTRGFVVSSTKGEYDLSEIKKELESSIDMQLHNDDCPGRIQSMSRSNVDIEGVSRKYIRLFTTIDFKGGHCYKRISGFEVVNKRSWKKHVKIHLSLYVFSTLDFNGNIKFHVEPVTTIDVIKNQSLHWFSRALKDITGVIRFQSYKSFDIDTKKWDQRFAIEAKELVKDIFDPSFYSRWDDITLKVTGNLVDKLVGSENNPGIINQRMKWANSSFRELRVRKHDREAPPNCAEILKQPKNGGFNSTVCRNTIAINRDKNDILLWNEGANGKVKGKLNFSEVPNEYEKIKPRFNFGLLCSVFKLAAQKQKYKNIKYTLQENDSLWSLANEWYGSGALFHVISSYNKFDHENLVYPKDEIIIPWLSGLNNSVINPDDNLWELGVKNPSNNSFIECNKSIKDPNLIYGGQLIW